MDIGAEIAKWNEYFPFYDWELPQKAEASLF
jgi:hypothetical protein